MKSEDLFAALGSQYPEAHGWMLLPQVRDATGAGSGRTADGLAMNAWPSRGLEVHGFELKTHRGDWLRELKKPAKAESIFRYCDRWWIVVPEAEGGQKPVVGPAELPSSWGLLVCAKGKAVQAVAAPKLKPQALDRAFIASVLRRLAACATPEAKIERAFAQGREEGLAEGRRMERSLLESRGQRSELRYQRDNLQRLEDVADRCLKSIRRELAALKLPADEAEECGVVGMPQGERRVCRLAAGHHLRKDEEYHADGSGVKWLGYHAEGAQS